VADPNDSRRVLVLDGDLPQTVSIVRSLGRRGVTVDVGAVGASPMAGASRYASQVVTYPDPMVDGSAFVAAIAEHAKRTTYDLVIPVTEDSVHPLAAEREKVEAHAPVAIAPNEALALAANKERTFELAESLGVPVPKSDTFTDLEALKAAADSFSYPVVAKPGRSVASKDGDVAARLNVRYAHDAEGLIELGKYVLQYAPLIVQAYFRGDGVGIELIADRGEITAAFQHRRLHEMPLTGGGSSLRTSEAISPALLEHSEKLIRALGWHGVAMVEFKTDGDACSLMEINGRFWGSLPLAVAAGADFPYWLLELYSGRSPTDVAIEDGVVSRKLSSDVWWYIEVLRRSDPEPLIQWPRRRDAVRDLALALSRKHHFDVQSLEDLRPGLIDARRTVESVTSRFTDLVKKRLVARRMEAARSERVAMGKRIAEARHILFGCYGNINRSALAEFDLAARELPGLKLSSAGVHPREGRPADKTMAAIAAERGLDMSRHRSKRYTAQMVADADLIFVMELAQVTELAAEFPDAKDKTFLLGCVEDGGPLETIDPYGATREGYKRIFERVRQCTAAIAAQRGS